MFYQYFYFREIRRQLNLSKQRLEGKDRSIKDMNDNFSSVFSMKKIILNNFF